MEKAVITGATSMIGSGLIRAMLQDSEITKIYAVIRPGSRNRKRIPNDDRIVLVECDAEEYWKLSMEIGEECDVFYHFAWPRTATYQESYEDMMTKSRNIQVVLSAVKAAADLKCRTFVGAGSQSEYGISDAWRLAPDTPCNPVRADGVLHLAACNMAMILAKNLGIDCVWMRIFSVYGIYDRPNSMIMTTMRKMIKGERCSFTPAEQKWDYLYEDDIGAAFYLVGKRVSGSHIYCVGKGEGVLLKDYINIIRNVVAPEADTGIGDLPYPPEPVMNLCADITSLTRDTGWVPQISFEEGIKRIYKEILNNAI